MGLLIVVKGILNEKGVLMIFLVLWGTMFAGIPLGSVMLPIFISDKKYLVTYSIGMICVIIQSVFINVISKRTKYGTEVLGRIFGFRDFLVNCEAEKLEMMVMEQPTYFYDILPYTYVLGISDKWIKQFKELGSQPPQWYKGTGHFDINTFGIFMNRTMHSATVAMTSSPNSGGSGGGVSGGGSGGGGGGSW